MPDQKRSGFPFAATHRIVKAMARPTSLTPLPGACSACTVRPFALFRAVPAARVGEVARLRTGVRLTRAGVRETMLMDYVKFARAKGLSPRRVTFVHVLKPILIPVVTVTGLELGSTIAFSVVTETVFAWPGMGKLIIDSINRLDRPVMVAYLMIIVLMFVVINLVVDILYTVLDPRVRLEAKPA